jgi:hypothetical protein
MADQFRIIPPQVIAAGTDVPPEQVQMGFNSLAQQTTVALNTIVGESEPPSGPAGGDLSGTYPNPTVSAVHATSGSMSGVPVSGSSGSFTTLAASGAVSGNGFTAYLASPAAIGSTAPNTGAFTTLSASSTVSGTGFSNYLASPPAIGGTAANAGTFTNLTASGTVNGNGFTSLFASPPGIGGTAPAAAAFTTLSASSTVSGAGFSNYLASPPAIGGTAAAAGSFTTLSASSTITPSQTAGIVGTTTNNNVNAGSVGEYVTATGTSVALTANTPANVTSISLTAGDWEVSGSTGFTPAGSTSVTQVVSGINTTTATLPGTQFVWNLQSTSLPTGGGQSGPVPSQRISIATTTTVYLVAQAGFTVSTLAATGTIRARRVR